MTDKEYQKWFDSLKVDDMVYNFRGEESRVSLVDKRKFVIIENIFTIFSYIALRNKKVVFKEKIFIDYKLNLKKNDLYKGLKAFYFDDTIHEIVGINENKIEYYLENRHFTICDDLEKFLYAHFKGPLKITTLQELEYRKSIKNNKETILI